MCRPVTLEGWGLCYRSLQVVTGRYRWLQVVTGGYRWLQVYRLAYGRIMQPLQVVTGVTG
jgi:hypothetical protein